MIYHHDEAPTAGSAEGAKINVGVNAKWVRNEEYTPHHP